MKLTEEGSLIRTKSSRSIRVSDSPLNDVLQSLLAGPTEAERNRGVISAIPPGSRLLSATVKDGIAYLNFNDAFQFNTYGVEGYTAQLNQNCLDNNRIYHCSGGTDSNRRKKPCVSWQRGYSNRQTPHEGILSVGLPKSAL